MTVRDMVLYCHEALQVFNSPRNRLALDHELRDARKRGDDDLEEPNLPGSDGRMTDEMLHPFPFILTSLVLGKPRHLQGNRVLHTIGPNNGPIGMRFVNMVLLS